MHKKLFLAVNILIVGGTIVLMVLAALGHISFGSLKEAVSSEENFWLAGLSLTVLMFVATVVAPITTFFMVPLAAGVIGPIPSALFAVVGWFLGSVAAFIIARHFGKPLLVRFIEADKIALYEKYIPPHMGFTTLVFLRMVVSPDILSYAMGFMSSMRLLPYSIATAIGLLPFGFISAYAGSAFLEGRYGTFFLFTLFGVTLFGGIWFFVLRERKKQITASREEEDTLVN